jgi:hypothetical protein
LYLLSNIRVAANCRFGFNNGKTMVDGLDGENTISHTWQSGDFATIVYQLRLLGFNAVRLPFLFNDLLARKPQVSGGEAAGWWQVAAYATCMLDTMCW